MVRRLVLVANSQSSGLSGVSIAPLPSLYALRFGNVPESGPEDAGLVRGIRDFTRTKGKRKEPLAPAILVRAVMRLCRMGGMSHKAFGGALGRPDDTGQAWQRYYVQRQQMRVATLRHFVDTAEKIGWIDRRAAPAEPHPSLLKSGTPESEAACTAWASYERPYVVPQLRERLRAIEASVRLARAGTRISLPTVRQIALVDLDIESQAMYRRSPRKVGQKMRRSKELFGEWYWLDGWQAPGSP